MCAKVPRYIEIYSDLRLAILNNQYLPGSFLPTENELMEQFNASKTTIRHAVQLLREQGLVDVRQGSGTRITAMEQKTVTGKKYNLPDSETSVHVRYLTDGSGEVHNTKAVFDLVPAPPSAAKALGIPVGSEIYRLQRLQLADGVPFGYMVNYLSTAKSPQQMFGAVMKTYFAEKLGVSPDQIFTLSIMPCVAKKGEREMDLFYGEYAGHDVDAVLTTRELVKMIRSAHIRPDTLVEIPGDSPMHAGTGAGVIFGATGGVMEAALRTAYFTLKGENPPADAFKAVRSGGFQENAGVQEAEFAIGDIKLRTVAVSGLGNTRRLLQQIERGEVHYDFVEVMACPGGCSGGGGQPIHDGQDFAPQRGQQLYQLDAESPIRFSHENPDVQALYREYLGQPLSEKAHHLLHTDQRTWTL